MIDVMLVEDHTDTAQGLEILLRMLYGLEIRPASNLAEARRMIREMCPTHVFLDLNLPDGSGLDFLPEIKAACPGAKVYVCTAYSHDEIVEAAMRAGADRYLVKPLQPHVIAELMGLDPKP